MSFFQRQPHGLQADPLDQAQRDQFVGQQPQRPVAAALGGIAARQLDQALLDVPLDLDLVRARRLRPATERHVQPLGDQLPADRGDGPRAGAQGGDDLLIAARAPVRVVGQEEDPGMGRFACRGKAALDQLFQVRPLLRRQSHPILVHGSRPVLGVADNGPPRSMVCRLSGVDLLLFSS
jgi:hypothetical protein